MSRIELTKKVLETLNIRKVIYAEVAEGGAMGNTGGFIIHVIENEKLVCYETNLYSNQILYHSARRTIYNHSNKSSKFEKCNVPKIFDYHYGGFGNHTFLNLNFLIGRNEDSLLFKNDNHEYEVWCSNQGVFKYIIGSIKQKNSEEFVKEINVQLKSLGIDELESPFEEIKKMANELNTGGVRIIQQRKVFVLMEFLKNLINKSKIPIN